MWSEFKAFLTKSNALALAIGVIIGVALGAVVKSLVDDIIMPPIGLPARRRRLRELKIVLQPASRRQGGSRDPLRRRSSTRHHVRHRRVRRVLDRAGPPEARARRRRSRPARSARSRTPRTRPSAGPARARSRPPPTGLAGRSDEPACFSMPGSPGGICGLQVVEHVADDLGDREVPEPLPVGRDHVPRAPSPVEQRDSASSNAAMYLSQSLRSSRSADLNFQRLSGSSIRSWNRCSCSSGEITGRT